MIAHGGPLTRWWSSRLAERGHYPCPRPERGVVKGAAILLCSTGAISAHQRIDEPRIVCSQVVVAQVGALDRGCP